MKKKIYIIMKVSVFNIAMHEVKFKKFPIFFKIKKFFFHVNILFRNRVKVKNHLYIFLKWKKRPKMIYPQ